MEYLVRKAQARDWERIGQIYAQARAFMARSGNPTQWGTDRPPCSRLRQDMAEGNLYVLVSGKTVHGVFALLLGEDPTYGEIYGGAWHYDRPYGTLHRVAGDGSGGILRAAVDFSARHCGYLRIDTHRDNLVMRHVIQKAGFRECGTILTDDGTPRIAYDLLVEGGR